MDQIIECNFFNVFVFVLNHANEKRYMVDSEICARIIELDGSRKMLEYAL